MTTIDTLRKLVEVNKQIKDKFKNIVDEKQGIETHLSKIYEPITTAQESTKKAVEETGKKTVGAIEEQKTHLEAILTKINETPLMSEILDIIMRYPGVISAIADPNLSNALNEHELKIYNKAINLPKNKFELLREYVLAELERQKAEQEQHVEPELNQTTSYTKTTSFTIS